MFYNMLIVKREPTTIEHFILHNTAFDRTLFL